MIQQAQILKEWFRVPQSPPDPGSNAMMDVNKSLNIAEIYRNNKAADADRPFILDGDIQDFSYSWVSSWPEQSSQPEQLEGEKALMRGN